MGKLITVAGRALSQSGKSHPTLTYTITETDLKASKTFGNSKEVLLEKIDLQCTCSGLYTTPSQSFKGSGKAAIVANTPRVKCEGKSILLEGDNVTITCNGTVTDSSTTPPTEIPDQQASVIVTITNTNQSDVFASKT